MNAKNLLQVSNLVLFEYVYPCSNISVNKMITHILKVLKMIQKCKVFYVFDQFAVTRH